MFDRKLSQERLVVGIAGNAGAGKTTVANELKRLGASVVDADQIAGNLLRKGTSEYEKLVKAFGPGILGRNGQIDRKALAAKAFAGKAAVKKLNAIAHPGIIERIREELAQRRKGLIIVDAALLLDVGMEEDVDVTILVTAPDRLKVKRLTGCGFTREEAQQRLKLQQPDSKTWRKADFVLENKGSLAELKRKTRALWNFFYSARFQNLQQAEKQ